MPLNRRMNGGMLLTTAIAVGLSLSVWSLPAAAQSALPLVRPQTDAVTGAISNEARQAARPWNYSQWQSRGAYYYTPPQRRYRTSPYARGTSVWRR